MQKVPKNQSVSRKRAAPAILQIENDSDQSKRAASESSPAELAGTLTLKNSADPVPEQITIDKEQLQALIASAASVAATAAQVPLLKELAILKSLVTQLQQQITSSQGRNSSGSLSSVEIDVSGAQESANSPPSPLISPTATKEPQAMAGAFQASQKSYASAAKNSVLPNPASASPLKTQKSSSGPVKPVSVSVSDPVKKQKQSESFYRDLKKTQNPESVSKMICVQPKKPSEKARFPDQPEWSSIIAKLPARLSKAALTSRGTIVAAWETYILSIAPTAKLVRILPGRWAGMAEIFTADFASYQSVYNALGERELLLPTPRAEGPARVAMIERRARAYAFAICLQERRMLLWDLEKPLQRHVLDRAPAYWKAQPAERQRSLRRNAALDGLWVDQDRSGASNSPLTPKDSSENTSAAWGAGGWQEDGGAGADMETQA